MHSDVHAFLLSVETAGNKKSGDYTVAGFLSERVELFKTLNYLKHGFHATADMRDRADRIGRIFAEFGQG